MQREPVSSSQIAEVGFDPAKELLEIQFTRGGVYQYSGVPAEVHRELMEADSVGSYFSKQIKGQYPYSKLS